MKVHFTMAFVDMGYKIEWQVELAIKHRNNETPI